MKKIILSLAVLSFVLIMPVYADCSCSGDEIANKIENLSTSSRGEIISSLLKAADWDFSAQDAFANMIYEVRNSYKFKSAMKNYIESNCRIENNKIVCR